MSYYADHSWEEDRWKNKKKKMKWKPKVGENYFQVCLFVHGITICRSYNAGDIDFKMDWDIGNMFRTRKQAQQMAKKIKEILKGGSNG
jgi:hypothetical protein